MMKKLFKYISVILISVSVIAGSCTGRKNKIEHKNLIPEDELITILTEVYIASGVLTLPRVSNLYASTDTLSAYARIVEQHGYTQEKMDRTIRFYFIKNPKKMIKIYDNVLGRLSEMDSRIGKEAPLLRSDLLNLWSGDFSFSIPDPSFNDRNHINFQIPVSGMYSIKYTLTVYPDDQSINPRLGLYIFNTDSIATGKKYYFPSLPFPKDGRPHAYRSVLILKNPARRTSIAGWFINQECIAPWQVEHYRIDNIVLSRGPSE